MIPFFAYLIKSSVSLAILYCLFRLVLRNDKAHIRNRFLLLGILLVSAVIPLLNIQFFYEEIPIKQVEVIREFVSPQAVAPQTSISEMPVVAETADFTFNPYLVFYFSVILILVVRLIFSTIRVMQIIRRAEKRKLKKIVLAVVQDLIQPFTFLNKVVISQKDFTDNKDIVVTHEHAHIKYMHAIDLMVCELFTVVYFFNPFMWLFRRDLKLIHEYQADQAVLKKGIDAQKYQLLVLEKAVGERRFAMANHFTQKPILKRLKMMKKKNKNRWGAVKLVLFVPILMVLLQAFARPELIITPDEIVSLKPQKSYSEQWLERWTVTNIGDGIFLPEAESEYLVRKNNNVFVILMNQRNKLLVENEYAQLVDIKQIVKDFLYGKNRKGIIEVDFEEKEIPLIGNSKVSKGMISFRNDLATSKDEMNKVFRSIGEAYLEVWNEKALALFGESYNSLNEEKQKAINMAIPVRFSIARPKNTVKPPPPPPPLLINLKKDGLIYLGTSKKKYAYTFEEFNKKLPEIEESIKEIRDKYGVKYQLKAKITIEEGVTEEQVNKLKKLLKLGNVKYVNYSNNNSKSTIEKSNPSKDQQLVQLEKFKLSELNSGNLAFYEERQQGQKDKELFNKVKLLSDGMSKKIPSKNISVTLQKDRIIICEKTKYNYDEFEAFLKEKSKAYRRKFELKAEVKWDTAVGYQGIHKLAKILEKNGFKEVDYKPITSDMKLIPPTKTS